MIKKSIFITLIAVAIIGYIVYNKKNKERGSGEVERVQANDLPENLKNLFDILKGMNFEVTTNKLEDNPSITFKTSANSTNYSIVIKTQGEVLIYDNISGTPYRLFIKDNVIKNSKGLVVSSGENIANGILNTIKNKLYT